VSAGHGSRKERCPNECDFLLLSAAKEKAKKHKHNNDDDDDPKDSADRKKHSERRKHSRLQVGVSVSSLLVGLRNGRSRSRRRPVARAEGLAARSGNGASGPICLKGLAEEVGRESRLEFLSGSLSKDLLRREASVLTLCEKRVKDASLDAWREWQGAPS
jgi:hypothetical protein